MQSPLSKVKPQKPTSTMTQPLWQSCLTSKTHSLGRHQEPSRHHNSKNLKGRKNIIKQSLVPYCGFEPHQNVFSHHEFIGRNFPRLSYESAMFIHAFESLATRGNIIFYSAASSKSASSSFLFGARRRPFFRSSNCSM